MTIRIPLLTALGVTASMMALPGLAQETHHEKQQTKAALHNFTNRKIIHANNRVTHAHKQYHHYVHRKAAKTRNWLDHH